MIWNIERGPFKARLTNPVLGLGEVWYDNGSKNILPLRVFYAAWCDIEQLFATLEDTMPVETYDPYRGLLTT